MSAYRGSGKIRNLPLKTKLLVIIVSTVVAVSTCAFAWMESALADSLSRQVEGRSQSLASYLASRSADALLTNNVYELNVLIDDTMKNNSDVKYIFIVGENGEVTADSDTERSISGDLKAANGMAAEEDGFRESVKVLDTDAGKVADSAAPVFASGNATVRVGLGYDSIASFMADISLRLLILDLIILAVSAGVCYYLVGITLRPIRNLVALTKEVSEGNLNNRVDDCGKDEIGVLSASFNHMLDALQAGRRERDGYVDRIKKKNTELLALNQFSRTITRPSKLENDFSRFAGFIVDEMGLYSAEVSVDTDAVSFSTKRCCCSGDSWKAASAARSHAFGLMGADATEIGVLSIVSKGELSKDDAQVFQTLASQMAAIVQNVVLWTKLTEKEQALGMLFGKVTKMQEDERSRIARELHDETSHSLTAILLELQELKNEGALNEGQAACVGQMKELIDEALKDTNRLAWNLRPTVLDKFGLQVSLERYAESVMEQGVLSIDLLVRMSSPRLPADIEISIYRLVQEAVTNAIKYAEATEADIMLVEGDGYISVVVEDNGVGFDIDAVRKSNPGEHLGLIGMEERIALMSGTLGIESSLGHGTSIVAKIPLPRTGDADNE